jgi:hypothetical protein
MMKNIFTLLLISTLLTTQAQKTDCSHSMLLLKVHSSNDSNTIQNLHITIIEKKGNGKIKATPYQLELIPFNYDCYTVNLPNDFSLKNKYLHIESVCENINDSIQTYGETEVKLYDNDKISSCWVEETFRQNQSDYISKDNRVFYPIEVIMELKECN